MIGVLANRTYRHLFAAQALSLVGTGLTTVALALLAYDIAGSDAGAVLGTALALKMVAYVSIAPIAGAVAGRFPRRGFLAVLDLLRTGFVLMLPFVTEVWQIFVLVFAFQSFSAAFTPTFQATIPDVLKDEHAYTRALSHRALPMISSRWQAPCWQPCCWFSSPSTGCSSARRSGS